jgi:hypothetical protein
MSYKSNSEKEEAALLQGERYLSQLAEAFPARSVPALIATNECGIKVKR